MLKPRVFSGDLPQDVGVELTSKGLVAIDIETSGLDFRNDRIELIQVHASHLETVFIRGVDVSSSKNFALLLRDERVTKVFHHAMFDLRFLRHHLGIVAANVVCTKILAKVGFPQILKPSLKTLCKEFLDIEVDKSMQTSDWSRLELSRQQFEYAAEDVVHLAPLLREMQRKCNADASTMALASFEYVPTRVELDVLGRGDVFTY